MQARARFQAALRGEAVDRPPVWLMRQAGRHLPEYRALKSRSDFLTMIATPEIAAEVSLQPWRRYGMDAVIVFSDILIPAIHMGYAVNFENGVSIGDTGLLRSTAPRHDIRANSIRETLRLIRDEIQDHAALIGFGGSPWTVACYVSEGGSPKGKDFKIQKLICTDPSAVHDLLHSITEATLPHLAAQVAGDVDMIQIFDSWGGILSRENYAEFNFPYIQKIIAAFPKTPITLFCKTSRHLLAQMSATGCAMIGIGPDLPLAEARREIPSHVGLQGNLDPEILLQPADVVRTQTRAMLDAAPKRGFIANLGHGVLKETPVESVRAFVDTVKSCPL